MMALTFQRARAQAMRWIAARSERERALIALVAATASLALCAELGAHVAESRIAAGVVRAEREQLERQVAAESAAAFRTAADTGARAVRQASIGGETVFAARARAQADVEAAARAAGVTSVSVVLQDRTAADEGVLEPIAMRVEGRCQAEALAQFLANLAQAEESYAPAALDVSLAGDESRFRLDLVSFVLAREAVR
jgi:hypothetical protein